MTGWDEVFRVYDLIHSNSDRYMRTLDWHVQQSEGLQITLETGAGTGNLTLELLKRGHDVLPVDSSEYALEKLAQKCNDFDVKTRTMDIQKLRVKSNYFDAVHSMFVIPFFEDNKAYFSRVNKCLKQGGKFIISTWAPVNDAWHGIIELLEQELTQKGFLPEHQKEWKQLTQAYKVREQLVMKQGLFPAQLAAQLRETGFQNITLNLRNPYSPWGYSCTAFK